MLKTKKKSTASIKKIFILQLLFLAFMSFSTVYADQIIEISTEKLFENPTEVGEKLFEAMPCSFDGEITQWVAEGRSSDEQIVFSAEDKVSACYLIMDWQLNEVSFHPETYEGVDYSKTVIVKLTEGENVEEEQGQVEEEKEQVEEEQKEEQKEEEKEQIEEEQNGEENKEEIGQELEKEDENNIDNNEDLEEKENPIIDSERDKENIENEQKQIEEEQNNNEINEELGQESQKNINEKIVTFKDSVLEKAVRKKIGKKTGEILKKDVEEIISLDITRDDENSSIYSLEGIEELSNLKNLSLENNIVTDLSPLFKIKQLDYLNVSGNPISDFSFIQKINGLKKLYMDNMLYLNNLSQLGDLSNIELLAIGGNNIKDFSHLYPYSNITSLYITEGNLSDVSFLKNMTQLKYLDLSDNYINDLSVLSELTYLKELILPTNKIEDISPLSKLKKLEKLDINYNFIKDISPLNSCKDIVSLHLIENYVKDISSLSDLKKLKQIDITNNIISRIDVVNHMDSLIFINIYGNPIVDITPIIEKDLVDYDGIEFSKTLEAGKKAHEIIDRIIKPHMNDIQKEKAIYDYIIKNCQYDHKYQSEGIATFEDPHAIYGALIHKYAVCGGYAHTMKVLGQLAGLKCLYITGDVIDGGPHAWNIIKIEDKFSQIDATWDGGGQNVPANYRFFNISDSDMILYGTRTWDEKRYPKCEAITYNNEYKEYCKDNKISTANPKILEGEIYCDHKLKNGLNAIVNVEFINEAKGDKYYTAANCTIQPGSSKASFKVIYPNDPNLKSYYLSYELSYYDDEFAQIGYYSEGKTTGNFNDLSKISVETPGKIKIMNLNYKDKYSLADYRIKCEKNSEFGDYVITNINEVELPEYSALLYLNTNEDYRHVNLFNVEMVDFLEINNVNKDVTFNIDEIKKGNPSIKPGQNIYIKLVSFGKHFDMEEIMKKGLESQNVEYEGRWKYIGTVMGESKDNDESIGNDKDKDSSNDGSSTIKDIVNEDYKCGNQFNGGHVVEKDGYYYASECDSNYNYKLVKVNMNTGKKTVLDSENSGMYLSIQGKYLYYRVNDTLCRIDLNTNEKETILDNSDFIDGINSFLYIREDGIYYQTSGGYKLRRIDLQTGENSVLIDHECQDINVVNNSLYYRNSSDSGKVYKYDLNNKEDKKISDIMISHDLLYDNGYLYYVKNNPDTFKDYIYRMDLKGDNVSKVANRAFDFYNVKDGTIYGFSFEDMKTYKITSQSKVTVISDDSSVQYIIIEDKNIYLVGSDSSIVKILDAQ